MRRYCFIYNPAANPASSIEQFERIKRLAGKWRETRFIVSEKRGDIESLSRRAAGHCDVVVACGGDGTAREVAMGLLGSETAMGIVPVGSGNDFAKALNIPGNPERAVRMLLNSTARAIDVGKCNDIHFINTLGIGFDGLTNFYAQQSKLPGALRYTLGALKANANMEPFMATVTSKVKAYSGPLLMITLANGRVEGGGFNIAPDAHIDDNLLDVIMVKPVSKWILPLLLPFFVFGKQQRLKEVEIFKTDKLEIRLDRTAVIHADGEIIETKERHFKAEILPSALAVIGR